MNHHWQALLEQGQDGGDSGHLEHTGPDGGNSGHLEHTGPDGGNSGQDWAAGQAWAAGQEEDAGHLTAAVESLMSGRLQIRGLEGDASAPSSPIYGVACSTAFSSPALTPARQGTSRGAELPLLHQRPCRALFSLTFAPIIAVSTMLVVKHCAHSSLHQLLQHAQGLFHLLCHQRCCGYAGEAGTPSSGDWFSRVFSTGRKSGTKAGRGSITPTQLFSLNGRPTATSEPEDLFGSWHGRQGGKTIDK